MFTSQKLVESLDSIDPQWRQAYDCNPYAAAAAIGLDVDGKTRDELEALSDEYYEYLRACDDE